jgi:hypothetical protein
MTSSTCLRLVDKLKLKTLGASWRTLRASTWGTFGELAHSWKICLAPSFWNLLGSTNWSIDGFFLSRWSSSISQNTWFLWTLIECYSSSWSAGMTTFLHRALSFNNIKILKTRFLQIIRNWSKDLRKSKGSLKDLLLLHLTNKVSKFLTQTTFSTTKT